jgi:phage baseplate assembly protein W
MAYGRDREGIYTAKQPFQDFDVAFARNPITNDLVVLSPQKSIEQSVRLLVLTQFYERAYRPYLGTKIAGALFELPGASILKTLGRDLTTYINRYEPRVIVQSVDVSPLSAFDANSISIDISYTIRGQTKVYDVQVILKRVR